MESKQDNITILQEVEKRLRRLSPERLQIVSDFLADLEEREEAKRVQPGYFDSANKNRV
nr:hypothetical protein [Nostoc sp. WHI]